MPVERNTYRANHGKQKLLAQQQLRRAQHDYDVRQYEEVMHWRRTLRRIILLVLFLGMLAFLIVGL